MGIYIFYGEEDFLREYNSDKIINECNLSNPDMNFIKLTEESIGKLPDNSEQLPFIDSKKVIYIKNSGFFTSNKKIGPSVIERVTEYLTKVPEYVEIIFNDESIDKRLSPYKKISKIYKVVIDIETAKYLAEVCGPSMSYLYSEIKKLAVLGKEGEVINKELIDKVSVKSIQGIIFDLTDAMGIKDKPKSLRLLEELILKKEAEQFILIMLYKHFRNLFLLRVATDEGCASAEYLGINPYVYRKLLGQVKNYSADTLRGFLAKFTEFDYKSKRGEIDLRTGIEMVICCM